MYKIIKNFDDFLIISKLPGYEFHGDEGLLAKLREDFSEVHGVHRLDKETSGLMIFALNKNTQSELSQLFAKREVKKVYKALSDKKPRKKQGRVKGDLEKGRGGSYLLRRTLQNPSITDFHSYYLDDLELRCFELSPLTGKTHQLRVVMKSLGSPILGDKRYGGTEAERMYLHAYKISFSFKNKDFVFIDETDFEKKTLSK